MSLDYLRDDARKIIERATSLGAEYAEIRIHRRDVKRVWSREEETPVITSEEGFFVRVVWGGGVGIVSHDGLSRSAMELAVTQAVKMAKINSRARLGKARITSESGYLENWGVEATTGFNELEPAEKLNILHDIRSNICRGFGEVAVTVGFEEEYDERLFINSEGTELLGTVPRLKILYMASTKLQGKPIIDFWELGGAFGWELVKTPNVVDELRTRARDLTEMLGHKRPPDCTGHIILNSGVSGLIALCLALSRTADNALKTGRHATHSYATMLTILDNPGMEHSYGFHLYDDEGTPSRPRLILAGGEETDVLLDRETSHLLGLPNNGAARAASFQEMPKPTPSNSYILEGDAAEEDVFKELGCGIFISSVRRWWISLTRRTIILEPLGAYIFKDLELKPTKMTLVQLSIDNLLNSNVRLARGTKMFPARIHGVPVSYGGPLAGFEGVEVRLA